MSDQETPTPAEPSGGDAFAGHTYDGIQEYDNPTPRWWELLFVATIVFSPIYALWFHAPTQGRTLAARYEESLAENMRLQFGEIGTLEPNEATLVQYMADEKWLKVGASTFTTNCVSCHGREGEGISGPNLTDDHYKNVKTIEDIAKVVANGAANGAMPAWANRLHPNEVVLVSSYVASLRGQERKSPRPAEGKVIDPWPAAEPIDESTETKGPESQASRSLVYPARNT